jgi:anti-sigma-K factor RskA
VAALLLLVTAAGVALNGEFGSGPVPYRREVAMAGTEAAPNAAGMLVYGWERGELIVGGLPELPPDRRYQLWFAAPDQPWLSVGLFAVDPRGNAAVPLEMPDNVRSFATCDVTVEPSGGSPQPTGVVVLHGEW